jgi:hypothetical protein
MEQGPYSEASCHRGALSDTPVHSGQNTAHTFLNSCPKQQCHLAKNILQFCTQLEIWNLNVTFLHLEVLIQLGQWITRFMMYTQDIINTDKNVGPVHHTIFRACFSKDHSQRNRASNPNDSYNQQGGSLMPHQNTSNRINPAQ